MSLVSPETQQLTTSTSNEIDARPRKDFFISMLVRDINVNAAIIDLIDNCIDGAIRSRENNDFKGLWIDIEADQDHFLIKDNCGGIPLELARDYAFNFGRSPEARPLAHSVGQFGVGMKRALFKLGTKFKIDSAYANSKFTVEVDVGEWRKKNDDWTFHFGDKVSETTIPEDKRGTTITVTPLNQGVAEYFRDVEKMNSLIDEVGELHQINIERGIRITINDAEVKPRIAMLLFSKQLKPAYRKKVVRPRQKKRSVVTYQIWAGLGRDEREDPRRAGWYVFCNGRMILRHDQTKSTGWGADNEVEMTIPKYHNQFKMFRGYVMFDSKDGDVLPWNTTKTGLDEESSIYPSAKLQMLALMRPVIDFLNRVDKEVNRPEVGETGPLHSIIENAKLLPLSAVKGSPRFVAPSRTLSLPKLGVITYKKPTDDIDRVRKNLKVRSNREIGEKTFDYYLRQECD